MRRYQYAAIDDTTRVRALKIYTRHTQASAIDFIDTVVDKFPSRIQTIRTDRGHKFQALPLSCHGRRNGTSTSSQGRHS
jgi:transposase-like protein